MSRWTNKIRSFSALFEHRFAWAVIDRAQATLHGAEHLPRSGPALLVGNRARPRADALPLRALLSVCTGRVPRFTLDPRRAERMLASGEVVCLYTGRAEDVPARVALRARVPVVPFAAVGGRGAKEGALLDIHLLAPVAAAGDPDDPAAVERVRRAARDAALAVLPS